MWNRYFSLALLAIAGAAFVLADAAAAQGGWVPLRDNAPEWVYFDGDQLVYRRDARGNRLPDFSYAGYRNGMPIPSTEVLQRNFNIPVLELPAPRSSGRTAGVQELVDQACRLPLRTATRDRQVHATPRYLPEERYRAIVRIGPGTYEVEQPLEIHCDGIILSGAGDGENPLLNTHLVGLSKTTISPPNTGSTEVQFDEVILIGGRSWRAWDQFVHTEPVMRSRGHFAAPGRVEIGERSLELAGGAAAATQFSVGDNVIVVQKCEQQWLDDRQRGGIYQRTGYPRRDLRRLEWQCEEAVGARQRPFELRYNRYVTDVSGARITLDAPVYDHLNTTSGGLVYIARFDPDPRPISHVGVEGVRVLAEYDEDAPVCTHPFSGASYACTEAHTRNGIQLRNVDNSWIRNVSVLHFRLAGVATDQVSRVTIDRVNAVSPVSIADAGRRYNFLLGGWTQLVLVSNSTAADARHAFVANGFNISGNVFLRTTSFRALDASEGHQRWSHGLLWDNHRERQVFHHPNTTTVLTLYNRHEWGGHGWSTVQSAVWNSDLGGGSLRLQQPPMGMNWAIGVRNASRLSSCGHQHVPGDPYQACVLGQFRQRLTEREPASLYEAQLRLRPDLDLTHGS